MSETTFGAIALACLGAAWVFYAGHGTRAAASIGLVVAVVSIFGLGPAALVPLAVFVVGSGIATGMGAREKEKRGIAEPDRGRRGVRNVLAKLSVPGACGLSALAAPALREPLAWAYAAALAGAAADTFATELGSAGMGDPPRSLRLLRRAFALLGRAYAIRRGRLVRVEHGTPGAVSGAGLMASWVGACLVGLPPYYFGFYESSFAALLVSGIGLSASVAESALSHTPLGLRLGHHGRNAILSAFAALFGFGLHAFLGVTSTVRP